MCFNNKVLRVSSFIIPACNRPLYEMPDYQKCVELMICEVFFFQLGADAFYLVACGFVFKDEFFFFHLESKNHDITVFILKLTESSEGAQRCHNFSCDCSCAQRWRKSVKQLMCLNAGSMGLSLEQLRAPKEMSLVSLCALPGRWDGSLP